MVAKKKAKRTRRISTEGPAAGASLLKKLIEAHGPSGDESRVAKVIGSEISPFVDEIKMGKLGSLIAHKKGQGPKVMVAAHMDEIGLMVKGINNHGHIQVAAIGGIEAITLVGQTVRIYNNKGHLACRGVVTFAELHEDHEIEEIPSIDELYVDTGVNKAQLTKKGVEIGCYVVARHHFKRLGSDNIVSGKALDDRLGCYVLIEVARRLKNSKQDIYYVFTSQEEIGMHGAEATTYSVDPDWGLAVDTINAEDSDAFQTTGVEMGKGPAILVMDAEIITSKVVNDWITQVAKRKKIPIQLRVEEEGTTDATPMLLSKGGHPATTLCMPVRNLHSTVSVSHMKDIQATIRLVTELLKAPPKFLAPGN